MYLSIFPAPRDTINLPPFEIEQYDAVEPQNPYFEQHMSSKRTTGACRIARSAARAICRRWIRNASCGAVGVCLLASCTTVINCRTATWKLAPFLARKDRICNVDV